MKSYMLIILLVLSLGCTGTQEESTSTEAVVVETNPPTTSSPETSDVEDSEEKTTITIRDYDFFPTEITVEKGTKIIWENKDFVDHTVFIDGTDSPLLETGSSYEWTADETGTFDFQCTLHPSMKGKIIVE